NDLVALFLHQERKYVNLPISQPEPLKRIARHRPICKWRTRCFLQNLRGNVNSAGEHQLNSVEHNLTFRSFRDEAQSAKFESAPDCVLIIRERENDDSYRRIPVTQFAKHREAISIRQIDIKQNEADVGMFLNNVHCLTAVRSFEYDASRFSCFRTACNASRINV